MYKIIKKYFPQGFRSGLITFLTSDAKKHSIFEAILLNNIRWCIKCHINGQERREYKEDANGYCYYLIDPAVIEKILPFSKNRIADKLRDLVDKKALLRYEKNSWFFMFLEHGLDLTREPLGDTSEPLGDSKALNLTSDIKPNSLNLNSLQSINDDVKSQVYIKDIIINKSLASSPFISDSVGKVEASLIPSNPLAALGGSNKNMDDKQCEIKFKSSNKESLATLARLAISDSKECDLLQSPSGPGTFNLRKPLTTLEKLNQLSNNDLRNLENILSEIKWSANLNRDDIDDESFKLSECSAPMIPFRTNYDLEKLANLFIDTGISYESFLDIFSSIRVDPSYEHREGKYYCTEYLAYEEYVNINRGRGVKIENLNYDNLDVDCSIKSKTWDNLYFYNRVKNSKQFWKYAGKLVREYAFFPIFRRGQEVEWHSLGDEKEMKYYNELISYLESPEFTAIKDAGFDVLQDISSRLESTQPDADLDFELGEATVDDVDYGCAVDEVPASNCCCRSNPIAR